MKPITVVLQKHEIQSASLVGFRRQLLAAIRNDKPSFSERYPGQLWYNHIAGACAECAVARHLGVYWDMSVDTFNTTDLPGWNCEIRFSPAGKPKVKPRDTRRIIAVTGEPGNISAYTILGWLPAKEAMQPEWESDDLPTCWFPPPHAWRDIATLTRETPNENGTMNTP